MGCHNLNSIYSRIEILATLQDKSCHKYYSTSGNFYIKGKNKFIPLRITTSKIHSDKNNI